MHLTCIQRLFLCIQKKSYDFYIIVVCSAAKSIYGKSSFSIPEMINFQQVCQRIPRCPAKAFSEFFHSLFKSPSQTGRIKSVRIHLNYKKICLFWNFSQYIYGKLKSMNISVDNCLYCILDIIYRNYLSDFFVLKKNILYISSTCMAYSHRLIFGCCFFKAAFAVQTYFEYFCINRNIFCL